MTYILIMIEILKYVIQERKLTVINPALILCPVHIMSTPVNMNIKQKE